MEYVLFKYLWPIAILPKRAQFFVLGLLALLICLRSQKRIPIYKDLFSNTILITNIIFTFAILISILTGSHETSRVFAAINTCGITYVAVFFSRVYLSDNISLYKISKYMFINMEILLGLYIFYKIVGMSGNFSFMNGMLCGPDWLNGKYKTRFRGYLEYTNLVVYMYLYCFPISLIYAKHRLKKLGCLVYELSLMFPILATNSRTGIACALFLTTMLLFLFNSQLIFNIYIRYRKAIITFFFVLLSIIILCFFEKIQRIISVIMSARQGSTDTRMHIYIASLTKMWTESPIWGCGIKDYIGGFPYGSHSTYIGMFYKTGILGGGIYLFGMSVSLIRLLKRKEISPFSLIASLGYVCVFAISLLEDLDGANWSIVIFATLFSVVFSRKNNIDMLGKQ